MHVELSREPFSTPITVCRDLIRNEGVRTLFTGMVPTLAREVPGYFCFFGCYEWSRYLLAKPGQSKDDIGELFAKDLKLAMHRCILQAWRGRRFPVPPAARRAVDGHLSG